MPGEQRPGHGGLESSGPASRQTHQARLQLPGRGGRGQRQVGGSAGLPEREHSEVSGAQTPGSHHGYCPPGSEVTQYYPPEAARPGLY